MQSRAGAVAALLLLAASAAAAADSLCVLKLTIQSSGSGWKSSGNMLKPFPATITPTKQNATGALFLAVPTNSSCPPDLTASNAVDVLQGASLVAPFDEDSISFKPKDIKSNVTTDPTNVIAVFDLDALQLAYSGARCCELQWAGRADAAAASSAVLHARMHASRRQRNASTSAAASSAAANAAPPPPAAAAACLPARPLHKCERHQATSRSQTALSSSAPARRPRRWPPRSRCAASS